MAVIKDMVSKVESEHRGKLEQLNSIQQEQRSLQLGAESMLPTDSGLSNGGGDPQDSDAKSLDGGGETMVSEERGEPY